MSVIDRDAETYRHYCGDRHWLPVFGRTSSAECNPDGAKLSPGEETERV